MHTKRENFQRNFITTTNKVRLNRLSHAPISLAFLILFIMIYKLECQNEKRKSIEFEKLDDEHLLINIINRYEDEEQSLFLNKKDVYYLIGALHLLHKEMK